MKPKKNAVKEFMEFEKNIKKLSKDDLKEIVLINTYKLALVRAQLSAISDILIKKKIATYEEIWKLTHENFRDSKV